MPRRSRLVVSLGTAVTGLALLGLALASCDQEEGERCQRASDCAEGLTCNLGTGLCQTEGTGGLRDAGVDVPLDADEIDAAELDAGADAAVDAAIDAPPPV